MKLKIEKMPSIFFLRLLNINIKYKWLIFDVDPCTNIVSNSEHFQFVNIGF